MAPALQLLKELPPPERLWGRFQNRKQGFDDSRRNPGGSAIHHSSRLDLVFRLNQFRRNSYRPLTTLGSFGSSCDRCAVQDSLHPSDNGDRAGRPRKVDEGRASIDAVEAAMPQSGATGIVRVTTIPRILRKSLSNVQIGASRASANAT
jgi:hypothetical protein